MNLDNIYVPNYTIVHYRCLEELKVTMYEYLILDTMIWLSNENTYSKGITSLENHLYINSRNTIYKYLKSLIAKNLIKKQGLVYEISPDIETRIGHLKFEPKYIRVCHTVRRKLNLTLKEYTLLYLFYSFSRKSRLQCDGTNAPSRVYRRYVDISERGFYKVKNKFERLDFIKCYGGNMIELTDKAKKEFVNSILSIK